MPEMPEVETILRTLKDKLVGRKIKSMEINLPKLIKWPSPCQFEAMLLEKTITKAERRAKYLMFHLDNGYVLIIHLRMTGQLYYQDKTSEKNLKYVHITIGFDNEDTLMYADRRTLGALYVMPLEELWRISGLSLLGPEPLSPDFTLEYFTQNITNRKGKIKALLLNQQLIGGLGNIYVDECLALAGIDAECPAVDLDAEKAKKLYGSINKVISDGIEHGGTTFSDYRDGEGKKGSHQNYLRVYGQANAPCRNCGTLIAKKKVAGRTTYFCPDCQK